MKKVFLTLMVFVLAFPTFAQNFTGNGGAGRSITILLPKAAGFTDSILLVAVQGELVSNFSTYSAIKVFDRHNLFEQYKELESGIYADNAVEALSDIGNLPPTELIMIGRINKIGTNYNLQFSISKNTDKTTIASFSQNVTVEELNNLTAVRKASLSLLEKLGVTLSAQSKTALSAETESNRINAQFANARGVVAQRQGTEVAALSYFYQAAALDNSLLEAKNSSSVMAASISSGNIGDDVRNDIKWRKDWVARLSETEKFFDNFNKKESMPYNLFYSNEIKQGAVNYQNETVNISIETYLYGSGLWTVSIERALQAVYDGLNATKRKDTWGLGSWPQRGVTELNAFETKYKNFSVVFELLNEQSKVIGRQTLQANGSWGLNWSGRPVVDISSPDRKTLNFQNVNANDISDRMTIRVASVNDANPETAARSGVLQIKTVTKDEVENNDKFRFEKGEIKGFANRYGDNGKNLVIPANIWGDPVISIGDKAFYGNDLTNISIGANVLMADNSFGGYGFDGFPSCYKLNGRQANTYTLSIFQLEKGEIKGFANNASKVTNLVVPATIWGVPITSIGANAFNNYQLKSIIIPNSVTYIGDKAFWGSKAENITIGANVVIGNSSFAHEYTYVENGNRYTNIHSSFLPFYEKMARKAGVYSWHNFGFAGFGWIYGSNQTELQANKEKKDKPGKVIGVIIFIGLIGTALIGGIAAAVNN